MKIGTRNAYLAFYKLKTSAYRVTSASANKIFLEIGVENSYFRRTWYLGFLKYVACFVLHDIKSEEEYFNIQITKAFSDFNKANPPVNLPPPPKYRPDNIVKFPGGKNGFKN